MNEKEKRKIIEKEKLYFEQGEPTKKKKIKTALIVLVFILFIGVTCVTSYYVMKYIMLKKLNLNIDLDRDGWPELNIDTNGDKICDINCDNNSDKKPDYNIGYKKVLNAYFNLDTNGDKVADTNLINQKDANGVCILNCDVDKDNMPDTNLDLNNDGVADLNIDTNNDGICDINCDYKGSITPTINLDTNSDMKADLNIDTNNDGWPDLNITYGTDYTKAVFNIDKNNDGISDFNTINQMENNKCKLNCVLTEAKSSNAPAYNIDLDGDGKADINIDLDGKGLAVLNLDMDGDGIPEVNIDVDGDGKIDTNVDMDGDGIPDINLDVDKNGKADVNVDTNRDGIADENLVNQDTNNNGVCDLNCLIDKKLSYNIDISGNGICDINCDLNNDGEADANIDTNKDGKADNALIDMNYVVKEDKTDIITLTKDNLNSYKTTSFNINEMSYINVKEGLKITKKFIIENNTSENLTYDILWSDILNTFTYWGRLYFSLEMNGNTLISIEDGRVPYEINNGDYLAKDIIINSNEKQEYVLTYEFKSTAETAYNIGKMYYSTQEIRVK